ncbi:hypothetical protein C162_26685 [Paenibacillus sp. FSL R7-269]|uniref:hypothetical protein n=1 Tax=Paenibacillus sp. FSL R7-269 TaxID=1226755 RepID=UPI0003E1C587|nr:hypothetical protein [Paenibacillus sp. FSL R7-269]ETT40913.1 hypothetical protein C162_26685 [Paenibacillus sp. FSL R7-269]
MSEVKPVTIPHEVADTIETLRRDSASNPAFDNEGIAHAYVTETYVGPIALNLRKIPFDTLMRALLDGYERELTEEERREKAYADIREMYRDTLAEGRQTDIAYATGMEYVLDALGIGIPGINEGGAA